MLSKIAKEEISAIAISSTKIRKALEEGNMEMVNTYLGYDFVFSGKVISGQKIGSKIGFPTANIEVEETYKILPKDGVYAVQTEVLGNIFSGMMNIGYRPTVDGLQKTIEVHLFDCSDDLYQQQISVKPLYFLRSEQKFNSVEELKEQLQQDKKMALGLLSD